MAEINKSGRVVHKHDTEENWLKAVNFIPKQAEIIVYDKDDNYDYERFKIGDGVTNINALPFADSQSNDDSPAIINLSKTYRYLGRVDKNTHVPAVGPDGFPTVTLEGSNDVLWVKDGDVVNVGTVDTPKYLIMLNNAWREFNYNIDTTNSDNVFKIIDNIEENIAELNQKVDDLGDGSNVTVDYAENDETSGAYIKNRPFGDFGDEVIVDRDVSGLMRDVSFTWFSYINENVYPLMECDLAQTFDVQDVAEGDLLLISTSLGNLEGIVESGSHIHGGKVYYVGETFFYGDNTHILEETTNISNDTSTRVTGIAWPDAMEFLPPFSIYGFGLSDVTVYSIKKISQHITRIPGKYLPTPKLVNKANMVIDDSSTCFTLEMGGSETQLTFDITIDDNLPNGSVKYLTIRDLHNGNSVMSSAGNLYPVSMNGVGLTELHTVGVDDDVTLQIIVNRFYDSGPNDAYKAKWILLGHSLPLAEDFTF